MPTTSPVIKSAKDKEEKAENFSTVQMLLPRGRSSRFIGRGLLIFP